MVLFSPELDPRFRPRLQTRCGICLSEGIQNGPNPVANIFQTTSLRLSQVPGLVVRKRFPVTSPAFGEHNGLQKLDGILQAVVHQNIVVFDVILNLTPGRVQPAADDAVRILTTFPQSLLQRLAIGGQYENADRLVNLLLNLFGSLHIDIQKQVVMPLLGPVKKFSRGAVAVAEYVGMLQEFIPRHHFLEFRTRHKEIFSSILLLATRIARGVRDREIEAWDEPFHFIDQCRFAESRGRGNDVNRAHSRFCTCSRAFSISDLIARPISVIFSASPASPEVFESKVLASRFNSWSRKSSFLPTSPPWSSRPRKCRTCVFRRTNSS